MIISQTVHHEVEPSQFESEFKGEREATVERTGEQIVSKSLEDISVVETRITNELGIAQGTAEAVALTDEALVGIAEHELSSPDFTAEERRDAVEDVVIESALEIAHGATANQTPLSTFTFGKHPGEISDVVNKLNETHATLPDGHEAAPLVKKAIEDLSEHPVMAGEPSRVEFISANEATTTKYGNSPWGTEPFDWSQLTTESKPMPTNSETPPLNVLTTFETPATNKAVSYEESFTALNSPWQESSKNEDQARNFLTYQNDIVLDLLDVNEKANGKEAARLLETEHSVKFAPNLSEQAGDSERTNQLVYLSGEDSSASTVTSAEKFRASREQISEQDALKSLNAFLGNVADKLPGSDSALMAKSMRENLTYIGEKEYNEATEGIAEYWKAELEKNPDLQIYAVAGEIAKSGAYIGENSETQIKSDDYLLENILTHFSDDELRNYEGRVVVDAANINVVNPSDLKVILLDDWTISGSQIRAAAQAFEKKYPEFKNSIEVQLIAAQESKIKLGMVGYDYDGSLRSLPVRAYYKAHDSEGKGSSGAHITGSHSSVDFDFEHNIAKMVRELRAEGEEASMVAPTNIVRPYRYDGVTRASFVKTEAVKQRSLNRKKVNGLVETI